MVDAIDTAYVEIRPDFKGFGAEVKREIKAALATVNAEVAISSGGAGTAGLAAATAQTQRLSSATKGLNQNLTTAAAGASLLGSSAGRAATIGRVGMLGTAGAVTGVGAAAVLTAKAIGGTAITIESSFAGVRKTVDATEAQFQQLSKGLIRLSTEIPVNVNDLNRIAEAAGQLGIERDAIIGFTDTIAKLGVSTNLTVDQAATEFARLANITGLPQDQFSNLGSAIVDLGNNFATTEAEISEFALRIAGAGSIVGLAESDILAIGAAMSSVGVEAEAGGTAVQKVLLSMQKSAQLGGEQLGVFAKVIGVTEQGFKDLLASDPSEAFLRFVEGLNRVAKEGGSAQAVLRDLGLTDQRLTRAFLSLANSQGLLRDATETSTKAFAENNALQEEADKRFATTESRIQLAKNAITALANEAGKRMLPAIRGAADGIAGFAQDLLEGEGATNTIKGALDVLGSIVEPIFQSFRDNKDTIKAAFQNAGEAAKVLITVLRPLAKVVGFTLKIAFDLTFKAIGRVIEISRVMRQVFTEVVGALLRSIDKFLGGLTVFTDAASHIPIVGDKFKGVSDKINSARDDLRSFADELAAIGDKTVTLTVRRVTENVVVDASGRKSARHIGTAPTATTTTTTRPTPTTTTTTTAEPPPPQRTDLPEALAVQLQKLEDAAELASIREGLADDRRTLSALASFYRQLSKNRELKPKLRREFLIAAEQAEADIKATYEEEQAIRDAAKQDREQAAQEAKRDAEQAISAEESILKSNLELAQQSEKNLRDDRRALNALIGFYRKRVAAYGAATAEGRAAFVQVKQYRKELANLGKDAADTPEETTRRREQLLQTNVRLAALTPGIRDDEIAGNALILFLRKQIDVVGRKTLEGRQALLALRQAQRDLDTLRKEAKATIEENKQKRIEDQASLLRDETTLASLTDETLSDDERALNREIAFYRKQVELSKKNRAEQVKWLIELKRAQAALKDLREERDKTDDEARASFSRQSFEFMQTQRGFVSNLISNLIPAGATAGIVGGTSTTGGASIRRLGAEDTTLARGGFAAPVGGPRVSLMEAQAASASRRGMTEGQASKLIAVNQAILDVLTDTKHETSHPEALAAQLAGRVRLEVL